jgi:hypothetical protein
MSIELDRRRAHLASGGTINNYDRSHYKKEDTMIKVTLTTTTGSTKGMQFDTKENLDQFIEQLAEALPIGTAVNIDAPLVGIHSGWVQGKKHGSLVSN